MPDLAAEAERSRAAKIALRRRLLTARRELSPADRLAAASAVQGHTRDLVLDLVRREGPATVTAYVPMGAEPGGPEWPSLLTPYARVLLPVLLPDGDLDWAEHTGELAEGPRGLREPGGPRLGVDAVRSAGLMLVPALAVDRRGMRLGRGGGSYDRALARIAPGTLAVALLYDDEVLDEVPAEPHDRPVAGYITPGGGLRLRRAVEWTK